MDDDDNWEDPDDLVGEGNTSTDEEESESDMAWKQGAKVYLKGTRGKKGEVLILVEKRCKGTDSRWICVDRFKSLVIYDLRDRSRITGRPVARQEYEPAASMSNADMAKAIVKAKGLRN